MMDAFYIEIYVKQILDQVDEAESAYEKIFLDLTNVAQVFSNIHHFVVHVSNITKIVQPKINKENEFKKFRERAIKTVYPNIPQIDVKYIGVRNDLEHFDERIDSWVITSKRHNFMDKSIGNVSPRRAVSGIDQSDCFRWFDTSTKIFYFCGGQYDLDVLHNYVMAVNHVLCQKK